MNLTFNPTDGYITQTIFAPVEFCSDKKGAVKMSFNFPKNIIKILTDLSEKRDCSMTEVIKKAVYNEQFFSKIIDDGGTIKYIDKDGKEYIIVFSA